MNNKQLSIILMIVSSFFFALMGASVKYAFSIPLMQRVFMRDIIVIIVSLCFLASRRKNPFGHKENRLKLAIRGFSGFVGVTLFFYSVNHLQLAEATIINKLSPFFTTLFAVILLKEKIPKSQIPSLLIALIGGLLVLKPRFSMDFIPSLAGFGGAVAAGISYALVLSLTGKEDPYVVVFYFSLSSVLASIIPCITGYVHPDILTLLALFMTGIFASIGQITLTYSYKLSKASDVSIYSYLLIVFSLFIGWIFWNEVPDLLSLLGGTLIIIAGMVIYINYKISKNKII